MFASHLDTVNQCMNGIVRTVLLVHGVFLYAAVREIHGGLTMSDGNGCNRVDADKRA